MNRIVVTGDIFRTSPRREPNQIDNVLRVHGLVATSLREATGIRPSVWFGLDDEGGDRDWSQARIPEHFFAALGATPSLDSWVQTYFERAPPALLDAIGPALADSFVVTFEMSPLFQSVLDGLDLPWIDLNLSPIRFLPDLCLSFRFSHHFDGTPDPRFFVQDEDISAAVARVKSVYGDVVSPLEGGVLFLGQTVLDRTLITPQGVFQVERAVSSTLEILNGRRLWVKPHPLALDNPIVERLLKTGNARLCDTNTYALFASSASFDSVTISSSAGLEGRRFGKLATILNEDILSWINTGPISAHAFTDSAFWSHQLATVMTTIPPTGPERQPRINRLRRQFGGYSLAGNVWVDEEAVNRLCEHPCEELVQFGTPVTRWFDGQHIGAMTCQACGHVAFPAPSELQVADYYENRYPVETAGWNNLAADYDAERVRWRSDGIEGLLRKYNLGPEATILELGCGFGGTVEELRSRGYNAFGVDLNPRAIEAGRAHGNLHVFHGSPKQALGRRKAALVFGYHALQRLPNPVAYLDGLRPFLAKTAFMWFSVPNGANLKAWLEGFEQWNWFAYPDHLNMFTPRSMACLANRAELELLNISSDFAGGHRHELEDLLAGSISTRSGLKADVQEAWLRSNLQLEELIVEFCAKDSALSASHAVQISATSDRCVRSAVLEMALKHASREARRPLVR